ncbi:hypothetical protein [Streptomyces sp. AM 2-1-1]|uniref:hypothetical protein n=1 Tax=Streptomyces sp. AM 2-1-1 TaxID=3028709 RepID=UPI0023BA2AE5|nr:hypothetical protein [Streptomyces sp. AM 2-1-1]WEH43337.1 hypothetical protein PZB77_29710 [Streptomyces sp. AM 2-1-1]
MTTVLIIVGVVVLAAIAGYLLLRGRATGGAGLKRRFGPEYDRVLARHQGDTKLAEQELGERVKRHGSISAQPLSAEAREQYTARWTRVQERFVDAPEEAVAEAGDLLTRLSRDRGFPESGSVEDRAEALSVHHPAHVDAYRRVHTARDSSGGTEELRKDLVEARALFDELLGDRTTASSGQNRTGTDKQHHAKGSVTS